MMTTTMTTTATHAAKTTTTSTTRRGAMALSAAVVAVVLTGVSGAQNRFDALPGHDAYRDAIREGRRLVTGGTVDDITWRDDRVLYRVGKNWKAFVFETGTIVDVDAQDAPGDDERNANNNQRRRAPRGRQLTEEPSPDGKWLAKCVNNNLILVNEDESKKINVTTKGGEDFKFATASWVYGEELRQNTAMWWSPDSSMVAFYEFDERPVKPYYLTRGLTDVQNSLYTENYPKAGAPNPIVGLLVYDVVSGETTRVDVGDDPEQYVYNIRWTPAGDELLFNRTNRLQSHLEVRAADPSTGESRLIVEETQETWQQNNPTMRFLDDGERFIWETERTGWKHYELRHLNGEKLATLSTGPFPANGIQLLDEEDGWFYYTAYSSETPLHVQLHRVRLDGTRRLPLTNADLSHTSISIAPDDRHFIAVSESIETPPSTTIYNMEGQALAVLAEPDTSRMNGRPWPEMFTFKAADGETDLYGVLHKPSNFDPNKTYPLIIDVYGGPWSQRVRGRFDAVNPYCEFGFIIAQIDNRGTPNRGKAFEDAAYMKLGIVDIADQVEGVKYLTSRRYISADRVGITGHSYGGYMAALGILKFPEVFHVAVAGAAVTDWRNYDTIYTERFMRTPQENPEGYKDGSCLTYAAQLEGDLLIQHGMVDDNVHPSNAFQLMHALQRHNKSFDVMFYPDSGHGFRSPSANRLKWEYLFEHLVEQPRSPASSIEVVSE